MRDKKNFVEIIAFALAALLAVTSVSASKHLKFYSYPAGIHVEGTITLKNIKTEYTIELNKNLTALVPIFINPGTYDGVGFLGRAIASDRSTKFHGLITLPSLVLPPLGGRGSFFVNFRVDKPNDLSDGTYVAQGELEITISPIQPGEAQVIWVHMKV